MRDSVLTCYCLRFVEKAVIFINAYAFVTPTCKRSIYDTQGCENIFKDAVELTVGVENENHNHAEQENHILHEEFRDIFCMFFLSNSRY